MLPRRASLPLLAGLLAVAQLSAQSAGPSRSNLGQPPVKRARGKARPAPASASQAVANQDLLEDLSTAYRILARTGVVDAYGHASVRNPPIPITFLCSAICRRRFRP